MKNVIKVFFLLVIILNSCNKTKNIKKSENKSNTSLIDVEKYDEDWVKKAKMVLEMKEGEERIIHNSKKKLIKKKKEIIKPIQDTDFEYSDYWRKQAYKLTKKYMLKRIKYNKSNCIIIRQGRYQPYLINYIGGQTYLVKIYCEYNCNKDYINKSIFKIQANYLGNNKWDFELIDQKLLD